MKARVASSNDLLRRTLIIVFLFIILFINELVFKVTVYFQLGSKASKAARFKGGL